MLRVGLRSSRALGLRSNVVSPGRQWRAQNSRVISDTMRSYADKPSITDSRSPVLPGSASAATSEPLPPGAVVTPNTAPTPATPTSTTIPAENVPLTPPPPGPKRRFFRKFFTTLFLLTTLGFGGGVYYSRINDNFHDFFTEYVPFGEEAVLYFEEQEFRKRFPSIANRAPRPPRDTGEQVKIPSQSGVSWRVANENKESTGRHTSSAKDKAKPSEAVQTPHDSKPADRVKAVEQVKSENAPVKSSPAAAPATSESKSSNVQRDPEVNEPSRAYKKIERIDPINIPNGNEPVVQELVKIMNDIIAVVNADNANARFTSTMDKAKSELNRVGGKILAMKEAALKEADEKIKSHDGEFDRAAMQLMQNFKNQQAEQEIQYRAEYEAERKRIHENYEKKLKSELDRANEVNEQKLKNLLTEQAVELKRAFLADVRNRVEEEREGRLGKLSELTNTVNDLEKLTGDFNSVVDANLKTQHLHVAVEAVRANLEKSQIPRPFTRELAALKEIASDDPVVNAAIASINPVAYQKGVPSSAALIDRFRRVASEVRKASLLPEEAGVASHASSYVLSKLLFKKKGLATGDDVESILTRTETFLEEGDLDGAAREMNGLKGWAKTLSKDWLGEVRKVLEVQQALDVIATEARLQSLRVE
ncbi:MICOS complex subunit mic60 [Botrytis cinerea]